MSTGEHLMAPEGWDEARRSIGRSRCRANQTKRAGAEFVFCRLGRAWSVRILYALFLRRPRRMLGAIALMGADSLATWCRKPRHRYEAWPDTCPETVLWGGTAAMSCKMHCVSRNQDMLPGSCSSLLLCFTRCVELTRLFDN